MASFPSLSQICEGGNLGSAVKVLMDGTAVSRTGIVCKDLI
jgi:hypothetical protein